VPEPGGGGVSRRRPLRVGLTGSVGSGKSTVAAALARRGAAVIDADALARRAAEEPATLERIARALGPELVVAGRLDRAATARKVFADADARAALEAIVHPWVRAAAAAQEAALSRSAVPPMMVVHDVPLLFERGLDAAMDATVVVRAPLAVRERRLADRLGDPAAVRARDAAQWPEAEKAALATFVIDNGGDEDALERHVAALWTALGMIPS
jgi:dephospho-CoA kinase